MTLKPISIRDANAFVALHHRHHKPVHGAKFAIACEEDGVRHGVAIVGRPVSRRLDDGVTAEITRLCSDGTQNVCSFLLSRAKRAAQAMGYVRVITYTLATEGGKSLQAAGWVRQGERSGRGSWNVPSRPRQGRDKEVVKVLWASCILLLLLSGCGFDRAADKPPGDPLPSPKRAQEAQYVTIDGHPEAERATKEESEKAMRAADEFVNREGVKFILHEGSK